MLEKYNNEILKLIDGVYYGIDLGTSYTVISCVDIEDVKPGQNGLPVKMITIPQHSPYDYDGDDQSEIIASILGVDSNGSMFVGNKLYRLKGSPDFIKDRNLFYHWKLDLGLSIKPLYKKAVRSDIDDAAKVAGKILNYCRLNHFEEDKEWDNVVVTVPASFQANQRKDVLKAIEYAKIKEYNQMLIDEPNAAFLGYLNEASQEDKQMLFSSEDRYILVVDFGGGTCDLSILKIKKPENLQLKMSNLAISRYNDLGGQDLDSIIAELYLLPEFLNKYQDEDFSSQVIEDLILPQLSVMAEKLKIDMARIISSRFLNYEDIPTEADLVSILRKQTVRVENRDYLIDELKLDFKQFVSVNEHIFTNNEYQLQLVDKVIQSVPSVIRDILKKSNKKLTDIDFVLFAGGSVQNLLFVQKTMELLNKAHALIPGRADLLVSKGAAVYSFYKNALGVELMQPISSDTIGVRLENSPFYPIIEAGKTLPVSVLLPSFRAQSEFQSEVNIPFCVSNEDNVVGDLAFSLPRMMGKDDIISIEANLSLDKVFSVKVFVDNELLGEMELNNPYVLANVSKEERKLHEILQELENSRMKNNVHKEKDLMQQLIFEYYDLGNYKRSATLGEEWLSTFDNTSSSINNMVYCAYDRLGNRKKSNFYLDQGLKYNPTNSSLQYNKSLEIASKDGDKAALNYLRSLSENLQNSHSIKFRMALLAYRQDEQEPAKKIGKEYEEGRYSNISSFSEDLLKQVLKLVDLEFKEYKKSSRQESDTEDKNKNLLRASGTIAKSDNK